MHSLLRGQKSMTRLGRGPQLIVRRSFQVGSSSAGNGQYFQVDRLREDEHEALFARNKDYPLPGSTTTHAHLVEQEWGSDNIKTTTQQRKGLPSNQSLGVLKDPLNYQRQLGVLTSFTTGSNIYKDQMEKSGRAVEKLPVDTAVECTVHNCPDLIQKEFSDLFPHIDPQRMGGLSAVVLSQQTKEDMSAWTPQMEVEREELMANFIKAASNICESLTKAGKWADFVDPASGRPYLGPFTNATLFETDDRFRHFGFRIEDLGCCKVIWHRQWGTHVFSGVLFTNAGVDSAVLRQLLPSEPTVVNSGSSKGGAVSSVGDDAAAHGIDLELSQSPAGGDKANATAKIDGDDVVEPLVVETVNKIGVRMPEKP